MPQRRGACHRHQAPRRRPRLPARRTPAVRYRSRSCPARRAEAGAEAVTRQRRRESGDDLEEARPLDCFHAHGLLPEPRLHGADWRRRPAFPHRTWRSQAVLAGARRPAQPRPDVRAGVSHVLQRSATVRVASVRDRAGCTRRASLHEAQRPGTAAATAVATVAGFKAVLWVVNRARAGCSRKGPRRTNSVGLFASGRGAGGPTGRTEVG